MMEEHMKKEKNTQLQKGIILIITSALLTCVGQLCWKLGAIYPAYTLLFYMVGFFLYGMGALFMIVAFKFGEMSVLHPMLSAGFIGSLFLGSMFLKEKITIQKLIGILLIILGVYFLSHYNKVQEDKEKEL